MRGKIAERTDRARRTLHRLRLGLLCAVSFTALVQAGLVAETRAESLKQALTSAYMTSPTLDAQRASLRASDEEVPRAKAGYRPTVTGTGDVGVQHSNPSRRRRTMARPTPRVWA